MRDEYLSYFKPADDMMSIQYRVQYRIIEHCLLPNYSRIMMAVVETTIILPISLLIIILQ